MERECCVCEVVQALGISQTRASRNLADLYDAGFLKYRRQGAWSLYSIDNEGLDGLAPKLMAVAFERLRDDAVAVADRKNLKSASRPGLAGGRTLKQSASTAAG
jgi:ArsR family transcriptional regulator